MALHYIVSLFNSIEVLYEHNVLSSNDSSINPTIKFTIPPHFLSIFVDVLVAYIKFLIGSLSPKVLSLFDIKKENF